MVTLNKAHVRRVCSIAYMLLYEHVENRELFLEVVDKLVKELHEREKVK